MGTNVIPIFIQKCLIMPFYLACSHPFMFGMVCFLLLVYRKFPSFFGLLVSFSPVVICTFVFLEIILNSNRMCTSEVEDHEKKKIDCSSLDGRELRGKRVVVLSRALDERKNKDFDVFGATSSSSQDHKKVENNLVQIALDATKISHGLSKDCQDIMPSSMKVDDTSESGSEGVDSLDASMEEVLPMLDELHPLLDTESTQPAHASDSYASSVESSQGHDSDDNDSEGEEPENQENEEEEEAQEEKDRGTESVMKWTADDEKNLRDVGKIELERNQRLEHLIAKRRARNHQRSETEKNLIDLDSNEPTTVVEELSRLLVLIPPKKNPFDLPYGSEEDGVIPGSAPSVLLPRNNPFDRPCDHVSPSNDITCGDLNHQQEFIAFQPKDVFFKRYESFAIGESSIDHRQEKRCTRFHPYFVAERTDTDEANYARLQSQLSGISDSKVSSTIESESVSSVSNHSSHAIHMDILEQDHQESGLISPDNHGRLSMEQESEPSDEEDDDEVEEEGSIETEQQAYQEINVGGGHNSDSIASKVSENVTDCIIVSLKTEAENKHGVSVMSCVSNSKQKEVVEEINDESSTSSYTEEDESSSCDSRINEVVNEPQIVEPVYDSSPSAIAKSLSNVTSLQDALHYLDKQSSKSYSSLASDMQVEVSEPGSPSRLNDQNLLSGEESSSDINGLWVASPDLSFVDLHESRTREVTEIREHDVIKVDFTVTDEVHNNFVAPTVSESEAKENTSTSSFPSMETDAIEESSTGEGLSQFDGILNIVSAPVSLGRLVTGDNFASRASFKGRTLVEEPVPPSPPSTLGIVESQISILPPIPEEILEEFKYEEERDTSNVFHTDHIVTKENSVYEGLVAPEGNPTPIPSQPFVYDQ